MSMRYFTLSAVCMLVFCMLLALSGTTDFPGNRPGGIPASHAMVLSQSRGQATDGEALASVVSPAGVSEPPGSFPTHAGKPMGQADARGWTLLPLGAVLVALWVLFSFRLSCGARR